jgi:hypothetical protein
VVVRTGGHARKFDLLGVDAPTGSACGAAAAKRTLKHLLPRRARVRLVKDRAAPGRGRYVYRRGKLVNAALLSAGGARAAADGLKLQSRLVGAEGTARDGGLGLWKDCPQPPPGAPPGTPPPTPPPTGGGGTITGQAAIDRARGDLAGRDFALFSMPSSTSEVESHLNLCTDGRYVEHVTTFSEYGGSTDGTYTGTWEVTEAQYTDQYGAAHVVRHNDDGTLGDVYFYAAGGHVYVNGKEVSVNAASLC